jgi:hypothetical protein
LTVWGAGAGCTVHLADTHAALARLGLYTKETKMTSSNGLKLMAVGDITSNVLIHFQFSAGRLITCRRRMSFSEIKRGRPPIEAHPYPVSSRQAAYGSVPIRRASRPKPGRGSRQ